MVKYFLCVCLLIIYYNTIAQNNIEIEDRSGKLFFKLGAEYRITPLPNNSGQRKPQAFYTNSDLQNSGATIYYGFDYFILENLSLGFSHSFRYALQNYTSAPIISGNTGSEKAEYSLFMGYHFEIGYYLTVHKESELFIKGGISLINRNSNFTFREDIYDNEGELIGSFRSQSNYNMQPHKFTMGYKHKKKEIGLGLYLSEDNPYFTGNSLYLIPFLNITYQLGKI